MKPECKHEKEYCGAITCKLHGEDWICAGHSKDYEYEDCDEYEEKE